MSTQTTAETFRYDRALWRGRVVRVHWDTLKPGTDDWPVETVTVQFLDSGSWTTAVVSKLKKLV